MERMGMEGLIWVSRALVRCGGPEMGARGFRCVWRAWNGYGRLCWVSRASDVLEWAGMDIKSLGCWK